MRRVSRGTLLIGGAFALLGVAYMVGAHASEFRVKAEAELGQLAGRVGRTLDPTTSGGGFVTFGPPRSYVALGDSVAGGDGIEYGWKWTPDGAGDGDWVQTGPTNPVWQPSTDMRPEVQRCRRSGKAYPHLVAAAANYELHDFSCSGASILNGVLGARSFSSTLVGAAQVGSGKKVAGYAPPSPEYDAARPDIVTITLGMDDIVFSDIVHDCYLGSNCVTTVADTEINRRLGVFKTNLETLLGELKDRGTAAEKLPRVVLTNYYDPFYPDSKKVCNDTYLGLGQGLAANEIDWIRAKVKIMNDYIAEASKTYPQAVTVDISKILVGHEYCSGDPWVYGISIWYKDFGNSAPFHPTPEGQQAIANRVSAAISKL